MTTQALIAGIVALLVGGLLGGWLGYWICGRFAMHERESAQAEKALIQQRNEELGLELGGARSELAQSRSEAAARAGFESLAVERLNALSERNVQLELTNRQLEEKDREILRLTGVKSKLETDLANEQGNGERLIQQFKVLANEILKENSKVFTEQSKESLAHLLNPLTRDLSEFRVKVEAVEKENLVGR